jgi:hypothetical protein
MTSPEEGTPESIPALGSRKEVHLEKILVPIDFSDEASAAVDYAARIGKLAGADRAIICR